MHGTRESASSLARGILAHGRPAVICPPAVFLREVYEIVQDSPVLLGAQDCHAEPEGAFTGDLSVGMLKEAGCAYVILGHSERRAAYGEHSDAVRAKAEAALAVGLTPIICVGEPSDIREQGQAEAFVAAQARASVPPDGDFVLAYEPLWAIGTGRHAAPADIRAMHGHLNELLPGVRVLYGGSVKAANAGEMLALPEVDGLLVGGASLKAEEFCKIVDASMIG